MTTALKEILTCPISCEIMTNPYMGSDGQTYQLENILACLDKKEESPINRQPMTKDSLHLNVSIKYLCDKYASGEITLDTDRMVHKITKEVNNYKLNGNINYINKDDSCKAILSLKCESFSFKSILEGPGKDIVIVIDISGSTGCLISAKDSDGNQIEAGFSINDVLKHSANSIIAALRPQDRVCFIIFNEKSTKVFDFIEMSEINKISATEMIVNSQQPGGMTNIWDGCETGLNTIKNREDKSRNPHILLLTDGVPTMSPARGEYPKICSVYKKLDYAIPIYGCGFGYKLKKDLLYDMCSKATGGSVHHICDGSMIATVFNNIIGLIINTAFIDTKVYLKLNNATFKDIPIEGDLQYELNDSKSELVVSLGGVQFEQSRDIVFNINDFGEGTKPEIIYSYSYITGNEYYMSEQSVVKLENMNENINSEYELFRSYVCNQLMKIIQTNNRLERKHIYNKVITYYEDNNISDDKSYALLDTWKEQMYLCIGSEDSEHASYYHTWGIWYCEQFLCSLSKQYTANFKDKSGEAFKSKLFDEMVDICSEAFDTVEPPKPSCKYNYMSYNTNANTNANVYNNNSSISMRQYNNINGGCLTGGSKIKMADNTFKDMRDIQAGDKIYSQKNIRDDSTVISATVIKVIETKYNSNVDIVCIGENLGITNWHPVFNSKTDNWEYPVEFNQDKSIVSTKKKKCDSVYTLLLDKGHIIFAGELNIPAVTLANHFTEGILKHPYFATDKVIEDLKELPGWDKGHIILTPSMFKKNGPVDGKYNVKTVNKISI